MEIESGIRVTPNFLSLCRTLPRSAITRSNRTDVYDKSDLLVLASERKRIFGIRRYIQKDGQRSQVMEIDGV